MGDGVQGVLRLVLGALLSFVDDLIASLGMPLEGLPDRTVSNGVVSKTFVESVHYVIGQIFSSLNDVNQKGKVTESTQDSQSVLGAQFDARLREDDAQFVLIMSQGDLRFSQENPVVGHEWCDERPMLHLLVVSRIDRLIVSRVGLLLLMLI